VFIISLQRKKIGSVSEKMKNLIPRKPQRGCVATEVRPPKYLPPFRYVRAGANKRVWQGRWL